MVVETRPTALLTRAVCLLVLLDVVNPVSSLARPVVPGGQGFGMDIRVAYGCGATPEILRVTNLNNAGAGSLRAALTAKRNGIPSATGGSDTDKQKLPITDRLTVVEAIL